MSDNQCDGCKPALGAAGLVERLHDEADIQKRFNWQRVSELLNEAASRISELSRRVGELNADRIQFAREWQSAEALAKANQEDAENFRYLEGIIEWKPKAYDGCSYGRFDLMWPNEEPDLRKAIEACRR